MNWGHEIAYFFGRVFLANALPHYISGLMGRAFQSPFAEPRGEGLSTSVTNVLWGFLNLVIAYLLICRVGEFDLRNLAHMGALGLGMLLIALWLGNHFGRFNGGNAAKAS